jgi:hypothetical protein
MSTLVANRTNVGEETESGGCRSSENVGATRARVNKAFFARARVGRPK